MKVRVLKDCDIIKEIELSPKDLNSYYDIVEKLERYYNIEQLLFILIGNYNDYCSAIYSITHSIFIEGSIIEELTIKITNINRNLLNLAASFRCYIDHLLGSQDNKGLFEKILPKVHEKIKREYDTVRKNNKDAQYLYCFRNEIQHNSLPMKTIGINRHIIGEDEKRARVIRMTFEENEYGEEYLKIGNGIQPLFDFHYNIIRNDIFPIYEQAKKEYKSFLTSFTEGDESCIICMVDNIDGKEKKNYIALDFTDRIDVLINKNPNRKPPTKGWFPGIINIEDIHNNALKNK
ncbi:MAG: hypothetical protein K9N05_07620 [Candidatus Marinimicrobia bacterium]|nr:hypothetical protein [Candidatus Neomarinimicrobiota bacterium]